MINKEALGMTMQINEEFINNLATQMVSESLMATLGGSDKFVEQIVRELFNTKVDPKDGTVSTWSSAVPYIKYLIQKVIRDELEATVKDVLDEKRPEIRKTIRRELMKKETIDNFFNAFTESLTSGLNQPWRTTINVEFIKPKD